MKKIVMTRGLAGSGKGQPVDAIIPTPDGDKRIGDLCVGDYVFGSDGKPTKVVGIFPRGILPLYKVSFRDGAELIVDGDHIWTFDGRSKRGKNAQGNVRYNYTTKELYANLGLVVPKTRGQSLKQIPLVAPLEYADTSVDIDPYVFGLYLADGSCGKSHVPRITKKEEGVVEYMSKLPDAPHNKNAYGDNTPYYTYPKGGNVLTEYLRKTGLLEKKSAAKFIPEELFHKSVEIRRRLLYGLMDGDGSILKKRIGKSRVAQYSTTSEKLKDDIIRLVTSLGGATKVHFDKNDFCWEIRIYTSFNPFLASKEVREWRQRQYRLNTYRVPSRIEKVGFGEVVCIAVAAKDQLYVADTQYHIVTHNTTWAKDRAEKLGWIRVSLDDLRESVYGGWHPRREKYILNLRDAMVRSGIEQGKTVVVDATNLHPKHERRLRALAEELGVPFEIEDSFLQKTPMECIEADLHRGKDAVGSKVIWQMYTQYLRPKAPASLKEKSGKRRALLVDLDGTLAINTSGRSYYDMTRVGEDKPNPLVAFLVDCVNEAGQYYADILFITGRTEDGREATEKWLKDNCLEGKGLFMREVGDKRKDNIVKRELIEQKILPHWEILGAIDNSLNCCLEYFIMGIDTLKAGIPTEDN